MIIISSGHTTSSPRLHGSPCNKLLKGKRFRGKTSLKTDVNRKRFFYYFTLLIKPPHQLSLARAIQPLSLRLKTKTSTLFTKRTANSRLTVKNTGLQKWFQRLHKERILEHWCTENLRVFQGAFELWVHFRGGFGSKTSTARKQGVIITVWYISLSRAWWGRFGYLLTHRIYIGNCNG